MQDDRYDKTYCYPGSDVLINKLNITDHQKLFEAEKKLTFIRLKELQENPIKGNFDFEHLKAIHRHIFQDIYEWAGKSRSINIGKGNMFCPSQFIDEYAQTVFKKYHSQCVANKENFNDFIKVFSENYGDLNALHPFREGNGRAQREFARLVCMDCGYNFDLSCTTHEEMLAASKLSFNKGDSTALANIFTRAVGTESPFDEGKLSILTMDDLTIGSVGGYDYYEYDEQSESEIYNEIYKAKISKMEAEKVISDAMYSLENNKEKIKIQTAEMSQEMAIKNHDLGMSL